MRLTRLILTNVKCYQYLDLSFEETYDNGADYIRNTTIILGNNGTGKSTILKSIALVLAGSSALGEIIGHPNNWIKNKEKSCQFEAHIRLNEEQSEVVKINIQKDDNLSQIISRNQKSLIVIDREIPNLYGTFFMLGYGVHRRVGGVNLKSQTSNFKNANAIQVATLFDTEATLYPFESWVMDMDYRRGKKGIEMIKAALNQLLPEAKFHKIDKEARNILFRNKDGIVTFGQLSDGFQIMANWLGDLLFRITNSFEDADNPLDATFLLIIDEVALHLHPAWQRTIIQSISSLFKNAQLITTTHSPFVAQQAGDSELFTIIRNEKQELDLFHYQNDPRKLLIHQVIMSDIFGLETDESVAVEQAKTAYRESKDQPNIESMPMAAAATSNGNIKTPIADLKGVDDLTDLPLNRYSQEAIDYKDLMNKLNQEINRLDNDKTP